MAKRSDGTGEEIVKNIIAGFCEGVKYLKTEEDKTQVEVKNKKTVKKFHG